MKPTIRRAEEELARRDGLLRQIFAGVEDLIAVVDLEGRCLLLSPSYHKALGGVIPRSGEEWLASVDPADHKALRDAFEGTVRDGSSHRVVFRLIAPDRGVRFIETQCSAMRNEKGEPQFVLWVSRDITERRLAEERLREQSTLLDQARDAICVEDLDERIRYWNKSAERLYGWSSAQALGRDANELLKQEGIAHAAYQELIARGEWHGQLRQTNRSGAQLIVESRRAIVRDEQGKPKSILIINTDVTEQVTKRKQIEEQFLRTQRMENLGALAGGIAHDLSNILAPIRMAVKAIQASPDNPGNGRLLEMVEASAKLGSDFVNQILSFARGAGGEKTAVDFGRVIEETVKFVRATFPKGIEVVSRVAPDLPLVRGDATQFHQLLLNLCVNARDAMPDGGRLTIEARTMAPAEREGSPQPMAGDYIEVKVTDTGSGMPPEVRARIFEPFFTTKDPGKGTGLGLSTVLNIVRSHQGFLDSSSKVGEGTTFIIHLPASEAPFASPSSNENSAPLEGRGELILVVDDEIAIVETTSAMLAASNYWVLSANDAAEALAVFARRHSEIAVVITDMLMPAMGGAALINALRRIEPGVRIIAVSGLPSEETSAEIGESEGITFLKKPYSMRDLLKSIRARLDSRRSS